MERVAIDGPQELALGMLACVELLEALGDVLVLEDFHDLLVGAPFRHSIAAGPQVQHLDVAPDLLIDAAPGFLAERAVRDQALQPRRRLVVSMPWIIRQRVLHRVDHVRERVEPDHVGRAKRRALGSPDERSGEGIYGIESNTESFGVMYRREQRKDADAVRDEVRRVLRPDHAFPERGDEESLELVEHPARCPRPVSARRGACSAAG